MAYKKKETILKHDELRNKHLAYIEKCESEYARTLDKNLGRHIKNCYEQLDYYDRRIINVKPDVDI